MRALLLPLLVAAACGSPAPAKSATPPATATSSQTAPPSPADAAPPLADCAEACTQIAVCWEEQNPGQDYNQGGFCVSECEERAPDKKKAFFECVEKNGAECAAMLSCG